MRTLADVLAALEAQQTQLDAEMDRMIASMINSEPDQHTTQMYYFYAGMLDRVQDIRKMLKAVQSC